MSNPIKQSPIAPTSNHIQQAAKNGKEEADMYKNGQYAELPQSVFSYASIDPNTKKPNTDDGLAFSKESLKAINPNADADGGVPDSMVLDPAQRDVLDFKNKGKVTPQENFAYMSYEDGLGKDGTANNGQIDPEKMRKADGNIMSDPDSVKKELNNIYDQNNLDQKQIPSYN